MLLNTATEFGLVSVFHGTCTKSKNFLTKHMKPISLHLLKTCKFAFPVRFAPKKNPITIQ